MTTRVGSIGGVGRLMGLFTLDYSLTLGSWGFMFTTLGIGQYPRVPSGHLYGTKVLTDWLYIINCLAFGCSLWISLRIIYTLEYLLHSLCLLKHGVHSSMNN